MVKNAHIEGNKLHLNLTDTEAVKVRLPEVLEAIFQKPAHEIYKNPVKRVGLYGYNNVTSATEKGSK